jgi:nucleoside phosphorylase
MSEKTSDRRRAVILTALAVEFQAVRAHLADIREERHEQGNVYDHGTFSSAGQCWDVLIGEIGAGNAGAALEAERAIQFFHPEVMLFVGVAGGCKDVKPGDVVAATKIYGYESGKAEGGFFPRPSIGNSTYRMEQRARAEARKPDWVQRLKGSPPQSVPTAYVGPIAAGEKVVASTRSSIAAFLREHYNDTLAIEMEGYGFLQATRANSPIEALVIRGISDLLDGKREADAAQMQEFAARLASAFAFEILAKFDEVRSIQPKLLHFPKEFPQTWNVPHSYKPFFTGRDHLLKYLHDALFTLDERASVGYPRALSGMAGLGKTQTAVAYAFTYRVHYQSVLWLRAEERTALIADLRKMARLLRPQEENLQDEVTLIATVMEWFRNQSDWLLILDNADDIAMISAFIPLAARGHILLTTRAYATGGWAERIELETLSPADGAVFLLRRSGLLRPHEQPGDIGKEKYALAQEIARLVDGFPLALEQAGAYIEETACRLAEYRDLYQTRGDELRRLRSGPVPDYPEAVATTWNVSLAGVRTTHPAAAELLRCLAFLGTEAIPEELLIRGAPDLGPELAGAADSLQLNAAIGVLLKYSLIQRDEGAPLLTVHRLVQDVQQDEMDADMQRLWAERVVRAVNRIFPNTASADWLRYQMLLPHAQVCLHHIKRWNMTFAEAQQLQQKMAVAML